MLPRILLRPRLLPRSFSLPQRPGLAAVGGPSQPRYHATQTGSPVGHSYEVLDGNALDMAFPKWRPPEHCPGCGAPSQSVDRDLPGHYPEKLGKRKWLQLAGIKLKSFKAARENEIWEEALKRVKAEEDVLRQLGVVDSMNLTPEKGEAEEVVIDEVEADRNVARKEEEKVNVKLLEKSPEFEQKPAPSPLCSRCHSLLHYHSGAPLPSYPTLKTLTNLIRKSNHQKNHIYHLLDAADLPMSLERGLRNHLYENLPRQFRKGLSVSYVVTRVDLLMPKDLQIASLMTWIKKVIKDALPEDEKVEGSFESNTRLHAISVRNGWGVGKIKEELKGREGGVWILGRVNVGKSRFVGEVWPEGGEAKPVSVREAEEFGVLPKDTAGIAKRDESLKEEEQEEGEQLEEILSKDSNVVAEQMVPPQFALVPPTVSDVPGTTAAPIRVSYKTAGRGGKVWGELIDLPGLEQWVGFGETGLLKYVREEKQKELVMETMVKGIQYTIQSGQSLLLGGLVVFTVKTPYAVVLAYPFTILPPHVTANKKVFARLSHPAPATLPYPIRLFQRPCVDPPQLASSNPNPHPKLELPEIPFPYRSAGTFKLTDDVTAQRSPQLRSKSLQALEKIPYRVMATDILLEGLGWVEFAVQVRTKRKYEDVEIEVWTPEGKGVGQRTTMGAYMLRKDAAKRAGLEAKHARPRKPMKGEKKMKKKNKKRGI